MIARGRTGRVTLAMVAGRGNARPRGRSAADLVYDSLREEILTLGREPGAQVNEKQIALAHGVSRTPVREAILRLAGEGLIDIVSKSGTYVARIPLANLAEAIVMRRALEEVSVRAAVERASASQVLGLKAVIARQDEALAAGDQNGFHAADEVLHEAIARAGGFPGIWTVVQQVKLQVDRYRRLTLPQTGRIARAIAEHRAIVDAIEGRDGDAAAAAMRAHIDGLKIRMDDILRLNPHYFEGDPSELERAAA
jgi:GntR family transcriptional regulator, rspAB operon transcriptional repressor